MKYSYKWLREISGSEQGPEELMKMVGLKGFELESWEDLATRYENFIVGEILEFHAHPNADSLRLVRVGLGGEREVQIVCGADNFEVWDKIPVALLGAKVPLNGMEIQKAKLRGEFSEGMLCSEEELCLGKDSKGIMILNKELEVGTPLAEALELDDVVLDFDVLPNRAHDCLSHIGMAREICAMEGRELKNEYSEIKNKVGEDGLGIEISDPVACPKYSAAILGNIKITSSPNWIKARLLACGMEPINNVVDITNYVMLETGSPLHAFDFANIANEEGVVQLEARGAQKGETMTLLDGKELQLDRNDLVIANKKQALALAGIKGGLESGVTGETQKIVLEAANFKGFNVRKSRQRHGLTTESQLRFEKDIAPRLARHAMARAIKLLQEYAGAKLIAVKDVATDETEAQEQELSFDYAKKLLGEQIEDREMIKIVNDLGFFVETKQGGAKVKVPFWRLDIEGQADLVEEIGRIVGYDNIGIAPIKEDITPAKTNQVRKFEWELIGELNALGLDEVRLYSFYGPRDVEVCGIDKKHFEIENPLSEELSLMRVSLIPNLLRSVGENIKHFSSFGIFELGREYHLDSSDEISKLAGVCIDTGVKDKQLFYITKGKMEALLGKISGEKVEFRVPENFSNKIYHTTRTAEVLLGGKRIGSIGQVNKNVAKKYGIKKAAMAFELDLATLLAQSLTRDVFTRINKFPDVLRDLSMFVDLKKGCSEVVTIIEKSAGDLLKDAELFDVYEDLENNRKSLAFHLSFNKGDATLEGEEVDRVMEHIIEDLEAAQIKVRTK